MFTDLQRLQVLQLWTFLEDAPLDSLLLAMETRKKLYGLDIAKDSTRFWNSLIHYLSIVLFITKRELKIIVTLANQLSKIVLSHTLRRSLIFYLLLLTSLHNFIPLGCRQVLSLTSFFF